MAYRTYLFILLFVSNIALHSAPRAWKIEDGTRSIQGEFVKRDEFSVTLRRADKKEVSLPLGKLHPEDRAWLAGNHPLPGEQAPINGVRPRAFTSKAPNPGNQLSQPPSSNHDHERIAPNSIHHHS